MAQEWGLPTHVVEPKQFANKAAFEDALHALLTQNNVDIICAAGFMRILSASFLDKWPGRVLNIHPSLLPQFPGLNTHQRALEAGVATHGATVHIMTAQVDAGPIIDQQAVPIFSNDTAQTLSARVLEAEHELYPRALRAFLSTHHELN